MTLKSEEKEQIRALRREGLTLREIAEKTKKNLSTVQRVCLDVKPDEKKIVATALEKKAPDKTEWERGFEQGYERGWTRGFEQGFSWGLRKAPERPSH
jgi:flagellar biosynthesis/type III secretory pathway protein FliH